MAPKRVMQVAVKKTTEKASHSEAESASPPSTPLPQAAASAGAAHSDVTRASPANKAATIAEPASTAAAATAAGAAPPPRIWSNAVVVLTTAIAVALVCLVWSGSGGSAPPHHPCACATAASASNPLAKAVLSRRSGVSGVHWHQGSGEPDRLVFAHICNAMVVSTLQDSFTSVDQLRAAMQASFERPKSRCVVWVTTPEAIQKVANAMKELLENNALGGVPVAPPQARGTLVVKSVHAREELKNMLPHRVVHMLTSIY